MKALCRQWLHRLQRNAIKNNTGQYGMSSYRSVVIVHQNWMSNVSSSDGKDDYCSPPPIKSANSRLTTNEIRTSSRLEHRSHANSENRVADETTLLLSLDNKLHDTSNSIDNTHHMNKYTYLCRIEHWPLLIHNTCTLGLAITIKMFLVDLWSK